MPQRPNQPRRPQRPQRPVQPQRAGRPVRRPAPRPAARPAPRPAARPAPTGRPQLPARIPQRPPQQIRPVRARRPAPPEYDDEYYDEEEEYYEPPVRVKAKASRSTQNSVTLMILLGILGIAVIALILDRKARSQAQWAFDEISKRMPSDDEIATGNAVVTPTQAEVHEMLGKKPDGEPVQSNGLYMETFSWGIFRKYSLYVYYRSGATLMVERHSVFKPLD